MPEPFVRWWEPRRPDEVVTADFLGRVLEELGATDLAARARAAHFDDYFAPPDVADGFELMRLVAELQRWGRSTNRANRLRARQVILAVKHGEFDGTPQESARWEQSASGQAAMNDPDAMAAAEHLKSLLADPAYVAKAQETADRLLPDDNYEVVVIARRSGNLLAIGNLSSVADADLVIGKDNQVLKDRYRPTNGRRLSPRELDELVDNAGTVITL